MAEVAEVAEVAGRLRDAVVGLDQSGRPLYARLAEIPLPTSRSRRWRCAEMIREHRGEGHIAACVAEGLDPIAMSVLTELCVRFPLDEYSGTRGWVPEAIDACADRLRAAGLLDGDQLTADGRALRDHVEDRPSPGTAGGGLGPTRPNSGGRRTGALDPGPQRRHEGARRQSARVGRATGQEPGFGPYTRSLGPVETETMRLIGILWAVGLLVAVSACGDDDGGRSLSPRKSRTPAATRTRSPSLIGARGPMMRCSTGSPPTSRSGIPVMATSSHLSKQPSSQATAPCTGLSFRAELYAEDASFTDSIKGIEVSGAEDIGSVRARRFGTGGPIAIEVIDVYAQTNGYERPTDSTIDRGDVISISISYRAQAGSEDPSPTEALVTFELGKRRPDGFDLHPESLITREEVFHATNG